VIEGIRFLQRKIDARRVLTQGVHGATNLDGISVSPGTIGILDPTVRIPAAPLAAAPAGSRA
jgi:hypothetical protein